MPIGGESGVLEGHRHPVRPGLGLSAAPRDATSCLDNHSRVPHCCLIYIALQ